MNRARIPNATPRTPNPEPRTTNREARTANREARTANCGRTLLSLALALIVVSGACSKTQADYPNRPLTLIVPWAAGGGTDAVARVIASVMERDLGKPMNVVNRIGGSGVVGHQAIAAASPDGYTIGIITVEIAMMHHQGLTDLTGSSFSPLGLINFDAGAVHVRVDSPYGTLGDLLQAIRTTPGTLKASGTAHGGIWHVALAGLLDDQKIPPASVMWVPSNGSAPAFLDLVAGGVDIVVASHPEGRSLIDARKVRSLVTLDETPSTLYPAVPLAKQAIGTSWTMGAWRGIAGPKNLPAEIEGKLQATLKKAYESQEYRDFMAKRGFGPRWADAAGFAELISASDRQMGKVMQAVGLAK